MASTQIIPFCTVAAGSGGNRLTPAAYAALTTILADGFQSGVASSAQINTALAQATLAAAGVANFMVNQGVTQNDDGNAAGFATNLTTALTTFVNSVATTRVKLAANTTYYVATTGNDTTGNGTSGSPWATIQKAVNYVTNNVDAQGYTVTISVANGTYTGSVTVNAPLVGTGTVYITGNTSTPSSCIISTTSNCFNVLNAGPAVIIQGFQIQSSGSKGVYVNTGGNVQIGNVVFGTCSAEHMFATDFGQIQIISGYAISGSATTHYSCYQNGLIQGNSFTVTISGTPNFSNAFAYALVVGIIQAYSITFSGTATGVRYSGGLNSVIGTNAGGANYFPGNSGGSVNSGAQYS